MRFVGIFLVVLLTAGAVAMPPLAQIEPGASPGRQEPPVAVCAIEEGSGRTTELSVLSTIDGPLSLTVFAGGETAGSIGHRTGTTGAVTIPVVDVAAVGTVAGLVEMPIASSAAGVFVSGAETTSAEACASLPDATTFLTGATTASGDTFELHLMNPYAGSALVELTVQSEAGLESNERFDSVLVPPRSSRILDFTDLIPGREQISVLVETVDGRVMTVGRQGASGDSAVWRATSPAQEWLLPIPAGSGQRNLIIATPNNAEVEYQIDFYGPDGLEEGLLTGVLAPRGQAVVDITSLTAREAAVRVVATGPLVATMWQESEEGLSVTTASQVAANRWFLPNAARPEDGTATLVILNTAIDSGAVVVRPLREGAQVLRLTVDPDTVTELALADGTGYLVESVGETVVLWTAKRPQSSSAAMGIPIFDG